MAQAKTVKKTNDPFPSPDLSADPATVSDSSPASDPASDPAPEPETEAKREPHELFWEDGQRLYQALQKGDEEARTGLASASQGQQQNFCKAQREAQKRVEELYQEYWSTLQQATGDDSLRVYQEATQKYLDALGEVQAGVQKEWEDAVTGYQKDFTNLQVIFQMSRLIAFGDYKRACQKTWAELDPNALSCESLASIGQSLLMGAQLMGGRPHGS
jgi:hypothetical protein